MGCDIHLVLERKIGGEWVGLDPFKGHHRAWVQKGDIDWSSPVATSRNYTRFARLAGVRGDGPPPRGVPDDASSLTVYLVKEWGDDGHSHSWIGLKEACVIWAETRGDSRKDKYPEEHPASYFFEVEDDPKEFDQFRLVFWFDN